MTYIGIRHEGAAAFAVRVTELADLDEAIGDAPAHDGPALVEVVTDPLLI